MKTNHIKSAYFKLNLTDSAKQRIIDNCNNSLEPKCYIPRVPLKYVAVTTVLLIVTIISAISIGASTENIKLKLPFENNPHIPNENLYNDSESISNENTITNADGYILKCDVIAGDTERVYFDFTLKRKNNTPITELAENEYIYRFDPFDSYLEFDDGHRMELYFTMLKDSTEYVLHFEASALFLNKDKPYLGKDANICISGINIQISSPNQYGVNTIICNLNDTIRVNVCVNNTVKTVTFEEDEFKILNGKIVIHRGELSATTTNFYGECFIEGTICDLKSIMDDAYLVYDGKYIPLGSKHNCGTINNGNEFVIGWLNENIVDPDKITAICIECKTIELD